MRKSTVFPLIVALASAGVSVAFWQELRAERALERGAQRAPHCRTSTPIAPEPVFESPG